jgi:tetratricopeptide (TPR) repeat protein
MFRKVGERLGEAISLLHLGEICAYIGEDLEARGLIEESLAISREIRNHETESDCERTLGQLSMETGDFAAARGCFDRALHVCEAAGDRRGAAAALWWLGKVDIATDDTESARRRLGHALRSFESFEMSAEAVESIEDHALLASRTGRPDEAARLHGAVSALRERLMLPRPPRGERRWRDEIVALRTVLGEAAFKVAWAEGGGWQFHVAVRRALALAGDPGNGN